MTTILKYNYFVRVFLHCLYAGVTGALYNFTSIQRTTIKFTDFTQASSSATKVARHKSRIKNRIKNRLCKRALWKIAAKHSLFLLARERVTHEARRTKIIFRLVPDPFRTVVSRHTRAQTCRPLKYGLFCSLLSNLFGKLD